MYRKVFRALQLIALLLLVLLRAVDVSSALPWKSTGNNASSSTH